MSHLNEIDKTQGNFKITVLLTILKLEDFLIKRHETKYFPAVCAIENKSIYFYHSRSRGKDSQ